MPQRPCFEDFQTIAKQHSLLVVSDNIGKIISATDTLQGQDNQEITNRIKKNTSRVRNHDFLYKFVAM